MFRCSRWVRLRQTRRRGRRHPNPHRRLMTTIHRRQAKTWHNPGFGPGQQRKGPVYFFAAGRRLCMNLGGDPKKQYRIIRLSDLIMAHGHFKVVRDEVEAQWRGVMKANGYRLKKRHGEDVISWCRD